MANWSHIDSWKRSGPKEGQLVIGLKQMEGVS
jgi:hypothetical protein